MRIPQSLLFGLLLPGLVAGLRPTKRFYNTHNYYVIEHDPFGTSLDDIARALGVEIVEQAGELENHWLVRIEKTFSGLSKREEGPDRVLARFQDLQDIAKRDLSSRSEDLQARDLVDSIKYLERQVLRQRVKRAPPSVTPATANSIAAVKQRFGIQDPLFPQQWHLINEEQPEHMMNVTGVWAMGITGKGVISSFIDDGLDYTSDDLKDNFDAWDSHDFNDHVDLPTPKLFDDHHGTRCAGQVAAQRNNVCGVGIAYDSKVAGVRILSGPISDIDEAAALNFGYQNVSVYSCSWGPPDNGMSMEGPNMLISKAVLNGINRGRAGKGSIFVFASGNGASHGDQCNFDGYTNSIYSVTVSAVDYKGLHPYYSEPCAANMIVAYSSGSGKHIVTTDRGKSDCATTHGGTSAAAPNAAGVIALALEVRPDLTWRDVQYICVETAHQINPKDPDWEQTAVGRPYSYKYGFGSLDGYAFVKKAQDWKLVKPQSWFHTPTARLGAGVMTATKQYSGGEPIVAGGVTSTIEVNPNDLTSHNFEKLEHINVQVWIQHSKRGDVEVEIVSPGGVRSVLAAKRANDMATTGFPGWIFMTVKHWGENPVGTWKIKVSDQSTPNFNGTFLGWNMVFWGEAIDARKARLYELPSKFDLTFPPVEEPLRAAPSATTTRIISKPTEHLDPGHGTVIGEKTRPAFPVGTGAVGAAVPSSSSTPTADEGWFSDLGNLVSTQKWFFGAIGLVAIFGIGAGVFFYRRRIARIQRSEYGALAQGETSQMNTLGGGRGTSTRRAPTTKALYDAFGEMSDEEDADENSRLQPGPTGMSHGLGFHSGFLDDEEQQTGVVGESSKYRDDPEPPRAASPNGGGSGGSNGSGDGSWEHASSS